MYKYLFLLLLAFQFPAFLRAQTESVPGIFSANSFEELSNKRNDLSNQIPVLQSQIDQIYDDDTLGILRAKAQNEFSLDFYQKQIAAILPKDSVAFKDSISLWRSYITYYNNEQTQLISQLHQARSSAVRKNELKKQLSDTKANLTQVEYQINSLMIPKLSQQNFMFWASIFFVVLMGILLLTFYFVVRSDNKVRFAIFGSDSGLQFVTLFSIIIAIILFGLTGILEGKELSALLGSIAGYILGKVRLGDENKSNNIAAIQPNNVGDLKAEADNNK